MRAPSVSVALCTFNGEKFLARQLRSLAEQTTPPLELVVGDDGSTDGTIRIIEEFRAQVAFPVRLERNPTPVGYRLNFRRTAGRCTGDLVAFCDQDDLWSAQKIAQCGRPFDNPDVMLVIHEAETCDARDRRSGRLIYGGALERRLSEDGFEPWVSALGFTQVFRRDILAHTSVAALTDHWVAGPIAHDQLVLLAALSRGKVVFLPEILALYRQHGDNTIGWHRADAIRRLGLLLTDRGGDYGVFEVAARGRAGLIRAQDGIPGALGNGRIAERYERLAEIYRLRRALYSTRSARGRIGLARRLITGGSYARADPWRLSLRQLPRDLLLGVALQPILRTPR